MENQENAGIDMLCKEKLRNRSDPPALGAKVRSAASPVALTGPRGAD